MSAQGHEEKFRAPLISENPGPPPCTVRTDGCCVNDDYAAPFPPRRHPDGSIALSVCLSPVHST